MFKPDPTSLYVMLALKLRELWQMSGSPLDLAEFVLDKDVQEIMRAKQVLNEARKLKERVCQS